MGKAKKRNFDRCKHLYGMCMKREDAINKVIERLNNNIFDVESKNLITLFGLHPEELSENGASWESVKLVDRYVF